MLKPVVGITSSLSFRSAVIAILGSGKKKCFLVNETVLGACSGGVWKLVMKMDGNKVLNNLRSSVFLRKSIEIFSLYEQNTHSTRLP